MRVYHRTSEASGARMIRRWPAVGGDVFVADRPGHHDGAVLFADVPEGSLTPAESATDDAQCFWARAEAVGKWERFTGEACDRCGHAIDGDGWDGLCGDCADDTCSDCLKSLSDPREHCAQCAGHVDGLGTCNDCGEESKGGA